jgi:small subunit ribosomal protein S6
VVGILEEGEARTLQNEEWGKRKLAYEIQRYNKAYYYYFEFVSKPGLTSEIERVLRLMDDCVRFQTIKLEEDIDPSDLDRFPIAGEEAPVTEEAEAAS